jgi:hypothetical protein
MIRHLKSHIEDGKEITKAIPINPMPCLANKERFFDKMTNWAGSTHRNPDGTLKPPLRRQSMANLSDTDKEKLPSFIPASKRYVCGAQNCSYLTTDIDMLRLHVTNLHTGEINFNCPHCSNQDWIQTADAGPFLEKALSHIKMHGDKLYKCRLCFYCHSQKQSVERHLAEKHKDESINKEIIIIREPDEPDKEVSPDGSSSASNIAHSWLCSECGYQCQIHEEMRNHCKNEHSIKSQYRCSLCTTRASAMTTMDLHFASKHPLENLLFYASYYRTDFSDNRVITGVPTVESKEPVKAVPIPTVTSTLPSLDNIRHIRQILIEEVDEVTKPQKSTQPSTPPKVSSPVKPVVTKIPLSAKSISSQIMQETTASKHTEKRRQMMSVDNGEHKADLLVMFGPLGYPQGSNFFCPICHRYKSKLRQSFKDHLYREFKYKK